MRKLFVLLSAVLLFAGCSKEVAQKAGDPMASSQGSVYNDEAIDVVYSGCRTEIFTDQTFIEYADPDGVPRTIFFNDPSTPNVIRLSVKKNSDIRVRMGASYTTGPGMIRWNFVTNMGIMEEGTENNPVLREYNIPAILPEGQPQINIFVTAEVAQ